MHSLPLPPLDISESYPTYYSKILDREQRRRYAGELPYIIGLSITYAESAMAGNLSELIAQAFDPQVALGNDLPELYEKGFRRKGGPGRAHYNLIMAAAPYKLCPYCDERRVRTLDHYLPKTAFRSLSVTASNLVPCCSDCNTLKSTYAPGPNKPAVFHPYFDTADSVRWLYARITESAPAAVKFEVRSSPGIDADIVSRARQHFATFALGDLYTSHAAQLINTLGVRLSDIFDRSGANGVRQYLVEEAEWSSPHKTNTWKRAFYEALASSSWYCSGGFLRSR